MFFWKNGGENSRIPPAGKISIKGYNKRVRVRDWQRVKDAAAYCLRGFKPTAKDIELLFGTRGSVTSLTLFVPLPPYIYCLPCMIPFYY